MIEIEQKELEKIKDGLQEAETKIRKFWYHHDNGENESDIALEGIHMIDDVISEIDSWLEEYSLQVQEDEQKLKEWVQWARA